MFPGMSFQRVWRLKFSQLEVFRIRRKFPPVAPFNTKAIYGKKPVRYTSIKKAKPRTILDIAKILQQKTKETKEKKQSVITGATTMSAATNQYDAMTKSTETVIPSAEVPAGSSTSPAEGPEEGLSVDSTLVDKGPTQDILDIRAVARHTPEDAFLPGASTHLAANRTFTEITPAPTEEPETVSVASPVDGRYSEDVNKLELEDVDQTSMPMQHVLNETFVEISNPKDAEHLAVVVGSGVGSAPVTALDIFALPKAASETVPKIVDAQVSRNLTDPVHVQIEALEEVLSPSDSTNISHSILNISTSEAAPVASSEDPTFLEGSTEELIAALNATPERASVSDQPPVVQPLSPSVKETEKIVSVEDGTMTGDALSSINLKHPVLVHTEVVEQQMRTDTAGELPVALMDPIQRLFLEKIREYSTKSKLSGGLVDAGPEYEKALNEELAKLQRLYGGGDLTNFPEFKFPESSLEEDGSE